MPKDEDSLRVYALTNSDATIVQRVHSHVQNFYETHADRIKDSHGWKHVKAVYHHTYQAILAHQRQQKQVALSLSSQVVMEIHIAALLHDVDDRKYFPTHQNDDNARRIMVDAQVPKERTHSILYMISLVSCSKNGNHVPASIMNSKNQFHLLIPRWADRLEAVGEKGVIRCYQYNREHGHDLSSADSPRPQSLSQIWEYATPERFANYQVKGTSKDMISHYYDKLLHVACPPPTAVRNAYLEAQAKESAHALIQVCLRFGKTGVVDEAYIQSLQKELGKS